MLAGDLDVHVDSSLSEPIFEGKAELTRRGDDFEIRQRPRRKEGESILDNLLNWVKAGDLRVRIPAGYGLEVQSKAGDIDVRDVPYLKGKLLAGDVDAQEIGGVDLVLQAGDVDVSLHLMAGEHRLKAKAGDVDIVLLAGSSVTAKGNISAGSLHVEGPFTRQESMTGGRFEGTVGAGAARLEVDLMAGRRERESVNEQRRILEMLAAEQVNVDEADALLSALRAETYGGAKPKGTAKSLHIAVDADGEPKVRVNVPLGLAKFAARFVPKEGQMTLQGQGVDLNELLASLNSSSEGRLLDLETNEHGYPVRIVLDMV